MLFAIVLLDRDPVVVWEIVSIQFSFFVLLAGICVEVAKIRSPETIMLLLVFGVLTGAEFHQRTSLMSSKVAGQFHPK
ncbi:MAG: hypothetical protein F4X99_16410 [Gammaproteobacteria bacterium]|nr:hypothetical protein [Gammaproteobacteria bacterium]